jgi:hypothetical protein
LMRNLQFINLVCLPLISSDFFSSLFMFSDAAAFDNLNDDIHSSNSYICEH